eukprot:5890307-Ditylum_brightwellii.AAC.1
MKLIWKWIHKYNKDITVTCPINSCVDSLLHPLGVWLSHHIHDITKSMPMYLVDSKQFKDYPIQLNIPLGAKIFTADATSMYMDALGKYLTKNNEQFCHLPLKAIKTALTIVMTYNVFTFGDTHFLQLTGAAMGTPPALDYAQTTF